MKTLLLLGVVLAAGAPVAAGAQARSHSHPAPREAGAGQARAAAEPQAAPAPARPQAAPAKAYRSAFSDYRRFEADPPAKGWREANDEVRDVGGHAGVIKGARGQAEAHPGVKP